MNSTARMTLRHLPYGGRQFGFSLLAVAADGGLLLLLFMVMARILGPVAYGEFTTAYSLTGLAFLLTELGINTTINREIARDREVTSHILDQAMGIRLAMTGITYLILLPTSLWIAYSPAVLQGIPFLAAYYTFWYFSQLFTSVFRAYGRMDLATYIAFVERGLAAVLGILFLLWGTSLIVITGVFMVAGIVRWIVGLALIQQLVIRPRPRIDPLAWRSMLSKSVPLGVIAVLTMIYWRLDTLLLSILAPDGGAAVGSYNAAYVVFSASNLLPSATWMIIFPIFSRLYIQSIDNLYRIFNLTCFALFFIGFCASALLFVLAPSFIFLMYGNAYSESVDVLRILACALSFVYAYFVIYAVLPAMDSTRDMIITVGIASAGNILLNVVLIPRNGPIGAALATLVAQALATSIGLFLVYRRFAGLRQPAAMS